MFYLLMCSGPMPLHRRVWQDFLNPFRKIPETPKNRGTMRETHN
jgi:hypothetical protein